MESGAWLLIVANEDDILPGACARKRRCLSKMAASSVRGAAAAASMSVRPMFSRDMKEAKRRVRELYRAWYREVPNTGERQRRRRGPGSSCPRSHDRAEVTSSGRGDCRSFRGRGSPELRWTDLTAAPRSDQSFLASYSGSRRARRSGVLSLLVPPEAWEGEQGLFGTCSLCR